MAFRPSVFGTDRPHDALPAMGTQQACIR